MEEKPILLVDSRCAFCSRSVSFILRNGDSGKFRVMSLYDQESKNILSAYGLPEGYNKSVVFIESGSVYVRSDAVLRIAKKLNGILPVFYWLKIIPRSVRDAFYNLVSRFRYAL